MSKRKHYGQSIKEKPLKKWDIKAEEQNTTDLLY